MSPALTQRGFTLIEMLAVVVILAILSSFALLNMNFDNKAKRVEEQANQLAALLELASDEAIYLQKELGLRFGEGQFEFYQLEKNSDETGQQTSNLPGEEQKKQKPYWLPVSGDQRLRKRELSEDMRLELEITGVAVVIEEPSETDIEEKKVKPHIMMLSNGEILPDFVITLEDDEGEHGFTIATGTDVPVIVERRE
ncbi:MAG: type II secretion system minor pseudopilin GspH [Gammaproteobacteria bacterium]|nr:type II secretion system minor pseudopilin GspH [Gammaproteobacteria bacterium]